MKIVYTAQMGVVENNRIIYSSGRLMNRNFVGDCTIRFTDGNFAFSVEHNSGRIVGFEGAVGCLSDIMSGDVKIPSFFDGSIIARAFPKFSVGYNYFVQVESDVLYDTKSNAIQIGRCDKDQIAVRIAENIYVLLADEKIYGIILNL